MPINQIMPRTASFPMADSSTRAGGAGELATPKPPTPKSGNGALTLDDFYQLLATQLRNQDSANPMDNSEMMNQMVQMATVQAMTTFTDLTVTTYATSMIGKNVEVIYQDETTKKLEKKQGIVSGVSLSGSPLIFLQGDSEGYGVGNIMHIGELPPEDPEEPDKPDTPVHPILPDGPVLPELPDGTSTKKGPGKNI